MASAVISKSTHLMNFFASEGSAGVAVAGAGAGGLDMSLNPEGKKISTAIRNIGRMCFALRYKLTESFSGVFIELLLQKITNATPFMCTLCWERS